MIFLNHTSTVLSFKETPLFYSEDKITIVYVLSGEFTAKRFNRIDCFQEEDLFFINAFETYSFSSKSKAIVLLIELELEYLNYRLSENWEQLELVSDIFGANQFKEMDLVYRDCAFIQLLLHCGLNDEYQENIDEKILFSLFEDYNIVYQNLANHKMNIDMLQRVYRTLSQIRKIPSYKFTLHEVAKLENMQDSYFAQIWKLLNGCSFLESVTKVRMQLAEKCLFFSSLNNEQICQLCGFSSKKYFYRYFQEWYHTTPLEWKKRFTKTQLDNMELDIEEANRLIQCHLDNLSYIHTNTHFIECYEKICRMDMKNYSLKVDWLHPHNWYQLNNESYMTCYGLDLLIHTSFKKNISIIFAFSMENLVLKKDWRMVLQQLKKHYIRYSLAVLRQWSFELCAKNSQELMVAREFEKELEKNFATNEIKIILKT